MKKSICLCVGVLVICLQVAAQCGSKKSKEVEKKSSSYSKSSSYAKSNSYRCSSSKSKKSKTTVSKGSYTKSNASKSTQKQKLIPYIESSYQLGLWGEKMPVSFTAGVEKKISKHLSVSGDVFFWKTDYELWCDPVMSEGKYTAAIPSVKLKLDPGKAHQGFFIGAGLGYVVAKD